MSIIIMSVITLGVMALVFGLGLGYAGVKFAITEDERVSAIRGLLPGANCGGCGFIGCDDLASAIVEGRAAPSVCPVMNNEQSGKISEIMGLKVDVAERRAAFIKCGGGLSVSKLNYIYDGLNSCIAQVQLTNGGAKVCRYGCVGGGSCVAACKFGAVKITDGIAVIDNGKCTACGMCVAACPKGLIELIPQASAVRVACNNTNKGGPAREACKVACVGCKLCVRACPVSAIEVTDFLARIDYSKCNACGECAKKCPVQCIAHNQ